MLTVSLDIMIELPLQLSIFAVASIEANDIFLNYEYQWRIKGRVNIVSRAYSLFFSHHSKEKKIPGNNCRILCHCINTRGKPQKLETRKFNSCCRDETIKAITKRSADIRTIMLYYIEKQ